MIDLNDPMIRWLRHNGFRLSFNHYMRKDGMLGCTFSAKKDRPILTGRSAKGDRVEALADLVRAAAIFVADKAGKAAAVAPAVRENSSEPQLSTLRAADEVVTDETIEPLRTRLLAVQSSASPQQAGVSHCINCGAEMDPIDASQFENCRECRRTIKTSRIRTAYCKGAAEINRPAVTTHELTGSLKILFDKLGIPFHNDDKADDYGYDE
jgi:hypothetical protein